MTSPSPLDQVRRALLSPTTSKSSSSIPPLSVDGLSSVDCLFAGWLLWLPSWLLLAASFCLLACDLEVIKVLICFIVDTAAFIPLQDNIPQPVLLAIASRDQSRAELLLLTQGQLRHYILSHLFPLCITKDLTLTPLPVLAPTSNPTTDNFPKPVLQHSTNTRDS